MEINLKSFQACTRFAKKGTGVKVFGVTFLSNPIFFCLPTLCLSKLFEQMIIMMT